VVKGEKRLVGRVVEKLPRMDKRGGTVAAGSSNFLPSVAAFFFLTPSSSLRIPSPVFSESVGMSFERSTLPKARFTG